MSVEAPARARPIAGRRSLARDLLRVPDVRLAAAWRMWLRNAAIYRKTYKFNVVPNFFEPFLYLLAMGLGLGAYLARIRGVRYMDFIAPGLVATAAMYGTTFEVTFNAFLKLQFGKVYDAVMSTPLSVEDIGLGEMLWGTTRSFIYGTIFLAVAAPFGVVHSWWGLLVPFAVILTGLMFSVIGLSFTAWYPSSTTSPITGRCSSPRCSCSAGSSSPSTACPTGWGRWRGSCRCTTPSTS